MKINACISKAGLSNKEERLIATEITAALKKHNLGGIDQEVNDTNRSVVNKVIANRIDALMAESDRVYKLAERKQKPPKVEDLIKETEASTLKETRAPMDTPVGMAMIESGKTIEFKPFVYPRLMTKGKHKGEYQVRLTKGRDPETAEIILGPIRYTKKLPQEMKFSPEGEGDNPVSETIKMLKEEYNVTIKISEPKRKNQEAAEAMLNSFGRNVVWFESVGREMAGGFVLVPDKNTVYINVNSQKLALEVAGHELIHSIKNKSPELYDWLDKMIKTDVVGFDQYVKNHNAKLAASGLRPIKRSDALYEELYGDFLGKMMLNRDFIDSLHELNPSMGKKFIRELKKILDKMIAWVKSVYGVTEPAETYFGDLKHAQDVMKFVLSAEYTRHQPKLGTDRDATPFIDEDGIVQNPLRLFYGNPDRVPRDLMDLVIAAGGNTDNISEMLQLYGYDQYIADRAQAMAKDAEEFPFPTPELTAQRILELDSTQPEQKDWYRSQEWLNKFVEGEDKDVKHIMRWLSVLSWTSMNKAPLPNLTEMIKTRIAHRSGGKIPNTLAGERLENVLNADNISDMFNIYAKGVKVPFIEGDTKVRAFADTFLSAIREDQIVRDELKTVIDVWISRYFYPTLIAGDTVGKLTETPLTRENFLNEPVKAAPQVNLPGKRQSRVQQHMRQVEAILEKQTGTKWYPDQAQAALWFWIKEQYGYHYRGDPGMTYDDAIEANAKRFYGFDRDTDIEPKLVSAFINQYLKDGRKQIVMDHYSHVEDLTITDPEYQGTGQVGEEGARKGSPNVTFFVFRNDDPEVYFLDKTRYRAVVGGNMYDLDADELGLIEKHNLGGYPGGLKALSHQELNALENEIILNGYSGFYQRRKNQRTAIMFEPVKVYKMQSHKLGISPIINSDQLKIARKHEKDPMVLADLEKMYELSKKVSNSPEMFAMVDRDLRHFFNHQLIDIGNINPAEGRYSGKRELSPEVIVQAGDLVVLRGALARFLKKWRQDMGILSTPYSALVGSKKRPHGIPGHVARSYIIQMENNLSARQLNTISRLFTEAGLGDEGFKYVPQTGQLIVHHVPYKIGKQWSMTKAQFNSNMDLALQKIEQHFKTVIYGRMWFKHEVLMNDWEANPNGEEYDKYIKKADKRDQELLRSAAPTISGKYAEFAPILKSEPNKPLMRKEGQVVATNHKQIDAGYKMLSNLQVDKEFAKFAPEGSVQVGDIMYKDPTNFDWSKPGESIEVKFIKKEEGKTGLGDTFKYTMVSENGSMWYPLHTLTHQAVKFTPETRNPIKPIRTKKAYKLFRILKSRPGELFPLFIGKSIPTPIGEWVPAENTPTKGFANRPGWHMGIKPYAPHIKQGKRSDGSETVWAEVEIPADVDWQSEADKTKTGDIRDRVPEGGHYRWKRSKKQGSEWIIAGAIKVNKLLTPQEVDDINSGVKFSPQQVRRATSMENFRAWFGESKVVDENGNPMVVVHGTPKAGFDKFDGREITGWFSEGTNVPDVYSDWDALEPSMMNPVEKERVLSGMEDPSRVAFAVDADLIDSYDVGYYPVFLSIQNPYTPIGKDTDLTTAKEELQNVGYTDEEIDRIYSGYGLRTALGGRKINLNSPVETWSLTNSATFSELLEGKGYDGIKLKEKDETTWGVFRPTQIKSVFNQGTWHPDDVRIMFSPEQQARVENDPAFQRWFEGSKVVNENGKPKVLVHGTQSTVDFDEFNVQGQELGSHFGPPEQSNAIAGGTTFVFEEGVKTKKELWDMIPDVDGVLLDDDVDPDTLSEKDLEHGYTIQKDDEGNWNLAFTHYTLQDTWKRDPNIPRSIPVFLSIKNPIRLMDLGDFRPENVFRQLSKMGQGLTKGQQDGIEFIRSKIVEYMEGEIELKDVTEHIKWLLESWGYDGVVYLNRREGIKRPEYHRGEHDSSFKYKASDNEWQTEHPEAQDSWIAFQPQQIKTVFNTQWNQEDPRFKFSPQSMQSLTRVGDKVMRIIDQAEERVAGAHEIEKLMADKIEHTGVGKIRGALREAARSILTKEGREEWYTGIFDRLRPIKQLGERAYKFARNETGTQAIMSMFLEHGLIRIKKDGSFTVDTANQGFLPFIREVGEDWKPFLYWMVAKRSAELKLEGRENWLSDADRKRIFDNTMPEDNAKFEMYARRMDEFNANILSVGEQAGLISPEYREQWEHLYYIPFYRILEDEVSRQRFLAAPNKSKLKTDAGIRKLIGHEAMIGDIQKNIFTNWFHMIHESQRNMTRVEAAAFAEEQGGLSDVFERVYSVPNKTMFYVERDGQKEFLPRSHFNSILSFRVDGEPIHYLVHDPALLESLTDMNKKALDNTLMNMFRTGKRWLTFGATVGPAFRMANALRDTMHTALINKSFKPFTDTWKGFMKAMKEDQDYIKFMATGFGFGSSYVQADDPATTSKFINKIVKREGQGAKGRILDTPRKLWAFWEKIGSASENAARVQLYAKLKDQGIDNFQAGFEGRDLLDFTLTGGYGPVRALIQTIPFLNARIQGLYKLGRTASDKELRRNMMLRGSIMVAASIALWGAYKDDDEWKELEDWDKWAYYHFWIGDLHYRIPKPFELGAVFSSFPVSLMETLSADEDGWYMADFIWHTFNDTFAIGVPQLLKPPAELWGNRSFFTGRKIVPNYLQDLPAGEQFDVSTSEAARIAGKHLGLSPKKLEHLAGAYFAVFGQTVLDGTDMILHNTLDYPEDPSLTIKDYPLLGRFMRQRQPAPYTKQLSWYYDTLSDIDGIFKAVNNYKRSGNIVEANKLQSENIDMIRKRPQFLAAKKQLTSIREQLNGVFNSKTMSAKQKRERVNALTAQRNAIVKRIHEMVRQ